MSKISGDQLKDTVKAILHRSLTEKKRHFTETIELQICLKNFDPQKDKKFSGSIRLPVAPKKKISVCVLADAKHMEDAIAAKVDALSVTDLTKMNKDKKLVRKLAKKYDAFLASASLIKKIPRLLGPGLNRAGKFPSVLGASENLAEKINSIQATIKFQLKSKNTLTVGVPIANVTMSDDEIVNNINLAVNFFVSLLKKNWQNIKRIFIKSTMGPSHRVFGF